MNTDKPLVAILIGVICTIPYQLFTMVTNYLGLSKYTLYQLDSFVITGNRPVPVLGFVTSSIVAGFIALVLYYAINKVGSDYLILKSVFWSLFAWALLELVLTVTLEGKTFPYRPVSGYVAEFLGATVFGVVLGLAFKKYLIEKPVKAR